MRLTGSRFGQPGMPVEVLPELAAYRELIVTVARELFLRRNPGRQRVPRGFTESFHLRLERVDKGSTIPVLERVNSESALLSEFDDFFSESRDLVQNSIIGVATSGHLPGDFPNNALTDFSRFGRTLRAGEFIEIRTPSSTRPARYSAAVRRILMTSRVKGYLQEASIDGVITEINSEKSSFQLRVGSRLILCSFEWDLFETVVSKLTPPGDSGTTVTVEGIVSFGPDDQPVSVPFVSGVLVAEDDPDDKMAASFGETRELLPQVSAISTHVFDRLAELRSLPAGWLDGEGEQISENVVAYVRRLLEDLQDNLLSEVRIYPTLEGEVRLEWRRYSTEFSLDFRSDQTVLYDEIDLDTGSETERHLSFDEFKDVRVLLVGG
jgi:hypothetical protein